MTAARGNEYPVPETMKAWVLGDPEELSLVDKPVPEPGPAEVLVRIDAIAVCATDIEVIKHGVPAMIDGGLPFNKGFTPGHEYMGTVVKLGPTVDEFAIGRPGRGRDPCRLRALPALPRGHVHLVPQLRLPRQGPSRQRFSTDGGFAEYAINNVNTMVHIPDSITDAEATLIVTAGTAMYGLDVMGGVIAGEPVVVVGPGPIGLMGVGVAKALGAQPVILTGTRDSRLEMGKKLGADHVVNVGREDPVAAVLRITGGKGVNYVLECSGAANALNEAGRMVNRGGRICLAAFPHEPVMVDLAHLVRNNIYVFGIRGEGRSATHRAAALIAQRRFDAKLIHTHTFPLAEVPTAIRYARERIDDAIKVVVQNRAA
jgi:L-iditol 2-dehydrogenase